MDESLWRQRFHFPWPTLASDQPTTPHPWSWHFDTDQTGEFGQWYVTPSDGDEPRLADPTLPPAFRAGFAETDTGAIIGLVTEHGFTVYAVHPGVASHILYHNIERAEVGSVSCDGRLVCIQHTELSNWYHPALRVLDMDGTPVADLSDGPQSGLWPGAWSPLLHDQRLIIHHQRADMLRPALWSVPTNEVHELPLALPGEVHARWYPDGQALLLNQELRGRNTLFRFDLHTHTLTPIHTDIGAIWQVCIQADGEVLYLWDSSAKPPDVRSSTRGRLGPVHAPHIVGQAYQDIDVAGIHGFLVEPATPRPHPTIFMARCNNIDHNRDTFSPVVQSWVDHGFAVVLVNYRGTMGYGRAWRDAILGNPGLTELTDIAAVYDWSVANGIADRERMILFGESWGGYLTLLGLGVQAERWAVGIAMAPVGDFIACYEDAMPPLQASNHAQFGGSPKDVPDTYVKASPITYVEQVRAPVMLVISEHDARCPLRQNENYIAQLRKFGKPHLVNRLVGGHGVWGVAMLPYVETALAFVAQHLDTQPPQG